MRPADARHSIFAFAAEKGLAWQAALLRTEAIALALPTTLSGSTDVISNASWFCRVRAAIY